MTSDETERYRIAELAAQATARIIEDKERSSSRYVPAEIGNAVAEAVSAAWLKAKERISTSAGKPPAGDMPSGVSTRPGYRQHPTLKLSDLNIPTDQLVALTPGPLEPLSSQLQSHENDSSANAVASQVQACYEAMQEGVVTQIPQSPAA